MSERILVTRRVPEAGLDVLRRFSPEVDLFPHDRAMTRAELFETIGDKDGLLCLLTDRIDKEFLDAAPKLRAIANYAVGFNNIDIDAATQRRIPVTNTPGVLTETTADLAWALLMDVARRLSEGDRFTRAGRFRGWAPMLLLGGDIHGKTLGIIGMGRIGQAVAKRASGFDMRILYTDVNSLPPEQETALSAAKTDLESLLRESDFVTIHVPLTKETRHLIGAKELKIMKSTAYLVNTSRGPVIDEKALADALVKKRIAGAGLDVFEREPHIEPELFNRNNVVLLPHIGSASAETRSRMAVIAAENLVAGLKGEKPPNCLNPEIYKE